jgi:hypothetical protein
VEGAVHFGVIRHIAAYNLFALNYAVYMCDMHASK